MAFLASLLGIVGVAAGLLWGCGLLVAWPLLPRRWRPLLPLLAPFLGFSLVSGVAHYAATRGGFLGSVMWLLVGLAALGFAPLLARKHRSGLRGSGGALTICLLAFILAVGPLLVLGYLTTIGATIDGVNYAVRAEYLQHSGLTLPEIEAGKPYLGWVRITINVHRAGDVFFVGLLGLLTGRRSYELLSVVQALFFGLTALSVFLLARVGLGCRPRAALLAAGLGGVHNLLMWPVYDNFLSQVIGLSLLPVVMGVGIAAQRRPEWRTAAVFGLLFSGLVSVYPIYAARALAATLLFWGLAWVAGYGRTRLRALGSSALWWLGACASAAAWNGAALVRAAGEVGAMTDALTPGGLKVVGPGNIHVFPPVVEVFGLIAHVSAAFGEGWRRVPPSVLALLGLFCVGLGAYRLVATEPEGPARCHRRGPDGRGSRGPAALGCPISLRLFQGAHRDGPRGDAAGRDRDSGPLSVAPAPAEAALDRRGGRYWSRSISNTPCGPSRSLSTGRS